MTTKKTTPRNPNLANHAVPNVFADQPAAMQLGPYTCKLTLGVSEDDDSDFPRPVVTIIMPTVNLIRMVTDLQVMFDDKEFKRDCEKMMVKDAKRFFTPKIVEDLALKRAPRRRLPPT